MNQLFRFPLPLSSDPQLALHLCYYLLGFHLRHPSLSQAQHDSRSHVLSTEWPSQGQLSGSHYILIIPGHV